MVNILPEIVMLDEALADGDTAFQKKSTDKIYSLLDENRTLVLVSHSDYHLKNLCTRAIWLVDSEIRMHDDPDAVLKEYQQYLQATSAEDSTAF